MRTVITPEAIGAMSGALARVAALAGMSERRRSWRHGSVALRRRKLAALAGVRADRLPIDREVRRLKMGIVAICVVAAALLWAV